jgi:hypothetical protein
MKATTRTAPVAKKLVVVIDDDPLILEATGGASAILGLLRRHRSILRRGFSTPR